MCCQKSNVILIQRGENCLFRSASYCICNTKDRHSEIRLRIINKIIYQWEYFIEDLSMESLRKFTI